MKTKSIYCRVLVYDNRCICGYNTRYKYFDTVEHCVKWVSSLKNRVNNMYHMRLPENDFTWRTYFI